MAQDKFNAAGNGSSRMARIRASRLTKSSDTEVVQNTDPGLIVSEEVSAVHVSAVVKEQELEIVEQDQELEITAEREAVFAQKASACSAGEDASVGEEPDSEETLQVEEEWGFEVEEQPEAQVEEEPSLEMEEQLEFQVEELPTLQITIPLTPGSQVSSQTESKWAEDQPTLAFQTESKWAEDQPTLALPLAEVIKQVSVESQETLPLHIPATPNLTDVESQLTIQLPAFASSFPAKEEIKEPVAAPLAGSTFASQSSEVVGLARRLVGIGLARLQEPQPEGQFTRGFQILKPGISLGLFPLLTLTNAFGLILISISYYLGNFGVYSLEFSFLLGLLIIFVPNVLRQLSPATLRLERIYLLCGLGVAFYLIAFMMSPLHVFSFDEFLHWVTADTILNTRHLFNDNSMLPVSPYYPGLEIITNAISSLTGLSTFYASIPLIVSTRIIMILALFLFYEQITKSSRMAGIATVIYMTNPHFIFFDSMYSYETLALPLTMCAFYILARYENIGGENRWMIFTSWIVLIAITFSHHMTDYVFTGLLVLWVAVSFFCATSRKTRIHLISITFFAIALAVAYAFLLNGNPVWGYLSSYFTTAFSELGNILTGTSVSRPLFTSTSAAPSPIWDRLLMMGSVALVAFALPFGLLTLWRLHRRNALAMLLGIFSLAYPLAQAFRFTSFGSEIADRSTAFLFLAVAYIMTILITHFWPTRKLSKRTIALVTCTLSVILLGGVILDAGSGFTNLPGPYVVGADGRSIEPEGINAALWTLAYLGPGNRIGTDRTNQMLMSTYGDQRVVTELDDAIDVSPIFYSTQFDAIDQGLLHAGQVKFLVVDMRLSTATPALGFYFVTDEPEANRITAPISVAALTKFDSVPQINRLFDSGDIVIYDTGAFLSRPDS